MWSIVLGVACILAVFFKVAVEREYDVWAPKMARAFVRLAGLMCPRLRWDWWSGLLYLQRVERQSGLCEATCCLVASAMHAVRGLITACKDAAIPFETLVFAAAFGMCLLYATLLGTAEWVMHGPGSAAATFFAIVAYGFVGGGLAAHGAAIEIRLSHPQDD
jgi:hypothetical protein